MLLSQGFSGLFEDAFVFAVQGCVLDCLISVWDETLSTDLFCTTTNCFVSIRYAGLYFPSRRAPSEKTQKLNDKIGNMISGLVKRQVRKRMEITGAATFSDSLPENAMDSLFEEAGTSRNQWHRRVH